MVLFTHTIKEESDAEESFWRAALLICGDRFGRYACPNCFRPACWDHCVPEDHGCRSDLTAFPTVLISGPESSLLFHPSLWTRLKIVLEQTGSVSFEHSPGQSITLCYGGRHDMRSYSYLLQASSERVISRSTSEFDLFLKQMPDDHREFLYESIKRYYVRRRQIGQQRDMPAIGRK
jgi:hypothetical protein